MPTFQAGSLAATYIPISNVAFQQMVAAHIPHFWCGISYEDWWPASLAIYVYKCGAASLATDRNGRTTSLNINRNRKDALTGHQKKLGAASLATNINRGGMLQWPPMILEDCFTGHPMKMWGSCSSVATSVILGCFKDKGLFHYPQIETDRTAF